MDEASAREYSESISQIGEGWWRQCACSSRVARSGNSIYGMDRVKLDSKEATDLLANGDGTHFVAYDIPSFPNEMVVASSRDKAAAA